jgi:hypothetical protein
MNLHAPQRVGMILAMTVLFVFHGESTPPVGSGQESRVYAVWPHSDYKPWQSEVYARDPDLVLRERYWMNSVGINDRPRRNRRE